MNIGQLIKGDDLIVLLKDKCSFRPIKNDEVGNIYRSIVNWPKLKHLRCQQLLCSTKLCPNERPDIDNLIVKVTFHDNVGNAIIGFCNIMVELKLITFLLWSEMNLSIIQIMKFPIGKFCGNLIFIPIKRFFLKSSGYELNVHAKDPHLHKGTGHGQLERSLSRSLPKLNRILECFFRILNDGITLTTCILSSPNSFLRVDSASSSIFYFFLV